MNIKPTLELTDEGLNGIYSMLGEAWRSNNATDTHYQELADMMKEQATHLARRAFALGVEVGKSKNG